MNSEKTNLEIINEWCTADKQSDVALLSAPITYPPIPSMALSIFQATLDDAGISSEVIYTMFLAMRLIGNEATHLLHNTMNLFSNGDLLFAHLTDVPTHITPEDYLSVIPNSSAILGDKRSLLLETIERAENAAGQIVEATSRRVINMGAKILAVSSIYMQQNASLAIIKRVKELDPSITTIIGGYNVSGESGMATLRNFPSVDYISFGEGDETIAEVCRIILDKSDAPMPYGIIGRNDPEPDPIPYRMTADMDTVMTPDYRDYFKEKQRAMDGFFGDIFLDSGINLDTVIFLEGSRGCWWGQKNACTFCGLNGLTDVYREKSAEHFHEELRQTMRRYPGARIQLTDNVLSRNMIRNLLPMMVEDPEDYHILAEIKTNLTSTEMTALAKAGFDLVQPGIESLNDHLLTLMGKGSTAIQNVALLKYARTSGIYPVWNFLYGTPGEEHIDYEQMMELMPLLYHLQPPMSVSQIQFNRFSKYGISPAEYGLELEPSDASRLSYQGNDDLIRNLGYELKLTGGPFYEVRINNQDLYSRFHQAVNEWRKIFYSESRPHLIMKESMLGIMILDTRPIATESRILLFGLRARLYRLTGEPVTLKQIQAALPDDPEEDIRNCLDELVRLNLMVCLSGRYLALATG